MNNVFFREQSSEFFSGQLNGSFDNPTETFWRKSKDFQEKFRETIEEDFFSRKKILKNFRSRARMQF